MGDSRTSGIDRPRLHVLIAVLTLITGLLVAMPTAAASTEVDLFACGLSGPFGMDFDGAGNLYVANEADGPNVGTVSMIDSSGAVSTFATGFFGPSGLEFDASGTLYVSDDTDTVFEVSSSGVLTPFLSGIGLGNPNAIGFDGDDGGLYVAHAGEVEKFDTSGTSVLTSTGGFSTNQSIAVDDVAGVVYTSDFDGNLYTVDQATGATATVLALGGLGYTQGGLTIGPDGFLYYSAWDAGEVLRIDRSDWSVTTFVDGVFTPRGLRFDAAGDLYVTSYETGRIYRSGPGGGTVPPFGAITGSLTSEWVSGNGWTGDATVTIAIDGTPEFFGVPVDGDGNFFFDTGLDLIVGTTIEVTGDTSGASKDVTLVDLTFDSLDPIADVASGTAAPFAIVHVGVGDESGNSGMVVTADGDGNWFADFDSIGFDITGTMGGGAQIFDDCDDSTFADAPPPKTIMGSLTSDWVSGNGWVDDGTVTIAIDGTPEFFGVPVDGDGNFFFDTGLDLIVGTTIEVTGDTSGAFKYLQLVDLTFDTLDVVTDTASGTAAPFAELTVFVNDGPNGTGMGVTADGDGNWVADFRPRGFDVTENTFGGALIFDKDGDSTFADSPFEEPPPEGGATFDAALVEDWIATYGFESDSMVTFEIWDDEFMGTLLFSGVRPTDGGGHYFLEAPEHGVDLVPGLYVRVYDATTQKDLILEYVTVDGVDIESDTVSGTAPAGRPMFVDVFDESGDASLEITSGDGNWSADFSGQFDLIEETGAQARLPDGDGDMTVAHPTPPPMIQASLTNDWVFGSGFTPGSTLTLTIYDELGGTQLFQGGFGPTGGMGEYFIEGPAHGYDLVPGMFVTVTDGSTPRELVLEPVTVEVPDFNADTVAGTAVPGRELLVQTGDEEGGAELFVVSDPSTGAWFADFDTLFDIHHGAGVQALLFDDDGDATVGEPPPPPVVGGTVDGIPRVTLVGTWDPGLPVTVTVWGSEADWLADAPPIDSFTMDPPPPGGLSDIQFDLAPGMVVEADNGEVVKDVVLVDLTLAVDLDTDVVFGDAPAGEPIRVSVTDLVDGEEFAGLLPREIVPEPDDSWSADYSVEFDLREDRGADASHADAEGDFTHAEDVFGLINGIVLGPDGPVLDAPVWVPDLGWSTCTDDAGRFEFAEPVSAHIAHTAETGPDPASSCGNALFFSESGEPLLGEAWNDRLIGFGDGFKVHEGPQVGHPAPSHTGDLTFTPNDEWSGFITREFGSWLDDGFAEGDFLFIGGTVGNDGVYEVARLTGFGEESVLVLYREDFGPFDGETSGTASIDVERVQRLRSYLRFDVDAFTIGPIEGTHEPVVIGTELEFAAPFFNPYPVSTEWAWGDDTTSPPGFVEYDGMTWWAVDGHQYTDPGVYSPTVTVTDEFGRSVESTFEYSVVFDPSSGFVTGGGWVDVDGATHKFGFNAKYDGKAGSSKGNFNAQVYGTHLKSDDIAWLVITLEDEAIFGGTATFDGTPGHTFQVNVYDGDRFGGDDRFRLQVWAPGGEPVLDIGDLLDGGKIQIHR